MFESMKISPSLLSADFMNMESSIRLIEDAGVDLIHVDVMDGHFVPNLTMGVPFVTQLKKITSLPLDVHLMVKNPLTQIPWFLEAGADSVTAHIEVLERSANEVEHMIHLARTAGASCALALNPDTPPSLLEPYIAAIDMVLIMSVYPGFSGQSYIEGTENKIAEVVCMAQKAHGSPLIQVDGGIDVSKIERVVKAGADVVVAGNAIFKADDPKKVVTQMMQCAHTKGHGV